MLATMAAPGQCWGGFSRDGEGIATIDALQMRVRAPRLLMDMRAPMGS